MKLGIIEYIDCAHYLSDHSKCGTMHGHTYKIEMIIEGEIENGMIIDFADLKKQVREILAIYDHRLFNDFIDYPTVENIALLLRDQFKEVIKFDFSLRIWEGVNKWCELVYKHDSSY